MGNDKISRIMDIQGMLKTIGYEYDKNGQIQQVKGSYEIVENWVQGNGSADPGAAVDKELIKITIAVGEILEIWNFTIQSETGNKPYGIGSATTGTFADPFSGMTGALLKWAGTTGTGLEVNFVGKKRPLIIIDNSLGTVALYCYIFAYDAYLGIVQVNTEEMGASYSGIKYAS